MLNFRYGTKIVQNKDYRHIAALIYKRRTGIVKAVIEESEDGNGFVVCHLGLPGARLRAGTFASVRYAVKAAIESIQ